MPRRTAATIVAIAALAATPRALQLTLDPRAIEEAIAIGQSRLAAERTRFHEPYRLLVGKAPVDYIEVITPFRRVVFAAQARAQIGDRGFGQRQAFELLATAPAEIELQVELTFHPLNTYIGVPDYAVTIVPGPPGTLPIAARSIERVPRFGARVDGMPLPSPVPAGPVIAGGAQPMLGGTVIAHFDGELLGDARRGTIVIADGAHELVRVTLDPGVLR